MPLPLSVPLKVKVAEAVSLGSGGPLSIVVSGAVVSGTVVLTSQV